MSSIESGALVNGDSNIHYVDWGAILAGVFISLAISSVFLAFGSAVGLSLTSFHAASSTPVIGLVIAAGLWLLWVQISSFMGGGYIVGRMRRRIGDGKAHEVELRDGTHGLIVWAVNIVIGAVIAGWMTVAGISGTAGAVSDTGAMDYYVDKLVRNDAATANPGLAANSVETAQIGRALANSIVARTVDESDRAYLVREVTILTGLPEADAQKRLDSTIITMKAQAETARKFAVLLAFLTAASLLVSGVAAWWAATTGGRHRDEGVDHTALVRWR